MAAAGVLRGSRIAIAVPNGPDAAIAMLGLATNATCAPLDPAMSESEFSAAFEHLRIDAVVVPAMDGGAAQRAAERSGVLHVTAIGSIASTALDDDPNKASPIRSDQRSASAQMRMVPSTTADTDVAILMRTSGTTGTAKRVALTHGQICHSAHNIAAALQLTAEDRCLAVMPLFHVHGLMATLVASLYAGASVAFADDLQNVGLVDQLRAFQATWYTAVPTIHHMVLREVTSGTIGSLSRLRFVRSSSAPLAPSVASSLEAALGVPVIEAYGMTEAAHQITSQPISRLPRKPGSVGRAAGPDVAIMDASANLLSAHVRGEVVIRGPSVIAQYDVVPDGRNETRERAWFRTGDEGWLDEDGYLYLTGRLSEIINRGGDKISPREVEEALLEHPAVLECGAFAVGHPTLGEDVMAAVVLKPGATATIENLRESLSGRLSDARIPNRISIVGQLPKGRTGKLLRRQLSEAFATRPASMHVAPRNAVESEVAALYQHVLNVPNVGVHDNFFVLGGDSLRGAQLLSRLQARFRVALPLSVLFRHPTPAGIGSQLQQCMADDTLLPLLARVEAMSEDEARHALASGTPLPSGTLPQEKGG